MSLRDDLINLVEEIGIGYINDDYEASVNRGEKADAILAKVGEALLSNEVQAPIRQELHHYPRTSTRDTVKTVIEMALDAVTGEGGER